MKYLFVCLSLSLLIMSKSYSQNLSSTDSLETSYFVSLNYGIQMSGIKDEDFILTNYSPLINISLGKQLTQLLSVKIGYKGYYFKYIEDDYRHYYNFVYLDGVIHINNLFQLQNHLKNWEVLLNIGGGYFYNFDYGRPNFCSDIGIQTNYRINAKYDINFEVSGIIGWDIYQGNIDILPGITLGFTYFFDNL